MHGGVELREDISDVPHVYLFLITETWWKNAVSMIQIVKSAMEGHINSRELRVRSDERRKKVGGRGQRDAGGTRNQGQFLETLHAWTYRLAY